MTASQEDYLKSIYILILHKNEARVTDIADYLQVSKASVNRALKSLKELGLVDYETYGEIKLTEKGKEEATNIIKKHNVLKAFLIQILNVNNETAEEEAKKMKHAISEDTVNKFSDYIKSIIKVDELKCNYSPENERCQNCIKLKKKKSSQMYFAIIFSTEKFRREKRNVPKSRKPPKSWETSQIREASPNPGNVLMSLGTIFLSFFLLFV